MKSIRPLSALLVCAALYGQSVSALAAADLTLTAPTEAVPGGSRSYFTITSPTPGFLTMTLDDASGTEVALLFDMEEIHTNENQLVFSAVDEDGSPLPAGSYSVSGELLDQFGKKAPIGNTVKYATEQHKQSGSRLQLVPKLHRRFPAVVVHAAIPLLPQR